MCVCAMIVSTADCVSQNFVISLIKAVAVNITILALRWYF